jgi:hypothetical protein
MARAIFKQRFNVKLLLVLLLINCKIFLLLSEFFCVTFTTRKIQYFESGLTIKELLSIEFLLVVT